MPTDHIEWLSGLCDAATPGPWATEKPPKDEDGWALGVPVAATARGQNVYASPPGGTYPESDRRLIAASRNALPALLEFEKRIRCSTPRICHKPAYSKCPNCVAIDELHTALRVVQEQMGGGGD